MKIYSLSKFLLIIPLLVFSACFYLDETHSMFTQLPVLGEVELSSADFVSASFLFAIEDDGGAQIKAKGICWDTLPNPQVNDNSIHNDELKLDSLSVLITNITPNKKYYARAYATNKAGTSYSNELVFESTPGQLVLTSDISEIDLFTAVCGATVSGDGGLTITDRGVCWSIYSEPTVSDNKTSNGRGSGTFSSSLTDLTFDTKYYVRSYITNSEGTIYGDELSFRTMEGVLDIDGNVYRALTIGNQTWMIENLKTTRYRNGDFIPFITDPIAWSSWPYHGCCDFNNSTYYRDKYGKLYNWYAVSDVRSIAPLGWHVPTETDYSTLFDYINTNLGVSLTLVKALAATEGWATHSNVGSIGNDLTINNSSGFKALPGGLRYPDGSFSTITDIGGWWSSTEDTAVDAWAFLLGYSSIDILSVYEYKEVAFSVRCVKD